MVLKRIACVLDTVICWKKSVYLRAWSRCSVGRMKYLLPGHIPVFVSIRRVLLCGDDERGLCINDGRRQGCYDDDGL